MSTVVVASDAPSLRAEVISMLEGPDTEIVEVNEGQAVAAAVNEHEPDLVVADLQMGNMGAMAVCLQLRLEESYGNLPRTAVLMLLDRRADVFLAKRSGAEGWLVKPLDPIRLRRAVEAILGGGTYHDRTFEPVPLKVPMPPPPGPPPLGEREGALTSAQGAGEPGTGVSDSS